MAPWRLTNRAVLANVNLRLGSAIVQMMRHREFLLSRRRLLQSLAMLPAGAALVSAGVVAVGAEDHATPGDATLQHFAKAVPKAELHIHIEGVTGPELAFVLAERNRVQLPFSSPREFADTLVFDSLDSFLAGYEQMMSVLLTGEDFHDVVLQYLEKAADAGIVYAEMHFDPQAHLVRDIPFEEVMEGITAGQRAGMERYGVRSRLIMAFQRDRDLDSARQALAYAGEYRDLIVGLGLDNYEIPDFPSKFVDVYREGAEAGFQLTSHCDLDVPGSIDHIRGCIEQLGVSRLDHGYSLFEDESLIAVCRERGIGFTACPTTDWGLRDVTEDYYASAVNASVRKMLDLGLRVGLNTDDPGLMGGRYLDDVYQDTARALRLSAAEIVQLSRNAFESSWAPPAEKREYLRQLDEFASNA